MNDENQDIWLRLESLPQDCWKGVAHPLLRSGVTVGRRTVNGSDGPVTKEENVILARTNCTIVQMCESTKDDKRCKLDHQYEFSWVWLDGLE